MDLRWARATTGALVSVVILAAASSAGAATRHVSTTADHGPGSLRKTIARADPGDTIVVPQGHFALAQGEIELDRSLTVRGAGASRTVVDGGGEDRIFDVATGTGPVRLTRLEITGGRASAGGGIRNAGTLKLDHLLVKNNVAAGTSFNTGGGIATSGTLGLKRVTMSGNQTSAHDEGFGGAIAIGVSPTSETGTVTINRSRLTHNSAPTDGFGGAVAAQPFSTAVNSELRITRTRIDHNRALSGSNFSGDGGAIFFNPYVSAPVSYDLVLDRVTIDHNSAGGPTGGGFGGGASISPRAQASGASIQVLITNTTVSANRAFGPSGVGGGLVFDIGADPGATAAASINNSTLAGNEATGSGGGISIFGTPPLSEIGNSIVATNKAPAGQDCSGAINSLGQNLERHTSCGFTAGGDLQDTNPLVSPLRGNGGPTPTRALKKASPARDAGDDGSCESADQRGVKRPQGPHCDIGAFEFRHPSKP